MDTIIKIFATNSSQSLINKSQDEGLIFILSGSSSHFSPVRKDEGTNNDITPLSHLLFFSLFFPPSVDAYIYFSLGKAAVCCSLRVE